MLHIRARYNYQNEIIDADAYVPQRIAELEEFLTDIYAVDCEYQAAPEKTINTEVNGKVLE